MQMFHRASMKLGLDKAVLHTMTKEQAKQAQATEEKKKGRGRGRKPAADKEDTGEKKEEKGLSDLNKKEIESLLKHGAYHVFLDEGGDAKSKEFSEQDIETILSGAKTLTVRYIVPLQFAHCACMCSVR